MFRRTFDRGPAVTILPVMAVARKKGRCPGTCRQTADSTEIVAKIDRHFDEFWSRNSITPAPDRRRCRVPAPGVPRPDRPHPECRGGSGIHRDKEPDKRTKKIDELLSRPGYHESLRERLSPAVGAADDGQPQFQFAGPQFEQWVAQSAQGQHADGPDRPRNADAKTLFAGRGARHFRPAAPIARFCSCRPTNSSRRTSPRPPAGCSWASRSNVPSATTTRSLRTSASSSGSWPHSSPRCSRPSPIISTSS